MMPFTKGLRFRKFDLQVHSPASKCFFNQEVTPDQIVAEALKKGLAGIAITDHNTGDWIDRIKKAAEGQPLIIFPGVEIHVPSGQRGIHVLAILDVDKTSKHVTELCGALKIHDVNGELISEHSLGDVINIVSNNIHNGLVILAHCTGPKGAISEMSGLQVTSVFENPHLLAVDVPETDFTDPEKIANKTRVIDLLDGTNPKYCYRKLAIIQTSDNPHHTEPGKHGLAGIGARYSYLKVDDHATLESLRLCFIDRETRIRQPFEYTESVFPRIAEVSIKGGFLDGVTVPLHTGLNCILGAKGTGKSLIVEFLRFALDQRPTQPEIRADHDQKLTSRLQRYGEVSVKCLDETGKEVVIVRQFNLPNHPYKNQPTVDVSRIFPVLFLSQNEIIRVAEDEGEQLKFIDRFFDFRSHQLRIQELEKELQDLDKEFARQIRAHHENREQKKQMGFLDEQLAKLSEQMKNPIYDAFERGDQVAKAFNSHRTWLEGLALKVSDLKSSVEKSTPPANDAVVLANPALQRTLNLCKTQKDELASALAGLERGIATGISQLDGEYQQWLPTFEQTKTTYEEAVRQEKADYKMLDQRRAKLNTDKEQLGKKLVQTQALVDKMKETTEKRDEKLRLLAEAYNNYLRDRLSKCKKFEIDSLGKLNVSIKPSTNVDEFKTRLSGMKRGSYLSEDEIQKICNAVTPREFILQILRYDLLKIPHLLKPIVDKTGVAADKIQRLATHLLTSSDYEQLLELQYKARPQDRPEIRYRMSSGRFELLRNLSIGQKCTAMLIMTLSDGAMPVIVDQPEDSLDIRSIWEDMCSKLRIGKETRQFIFTTHSSSLAVASDTDKFIVMEADANAGKVVFCGAIDTEIVREQVIEYLEGGIPTYRSKYLKYNIPRRKLFS